MMSVSSDKVQTSVLRNLSAVSLNKVVQVVGLVVTVALVPRLFGADDYGRFAFVLSLSYLGQVLGDFGTLDVLGRFVPGMISGEASRLYMRTLAFKVVVGSICGVITTGAALILVQWMTWPWAALIGLGVALHIVTWVPFQFALGLNRVGTWMAEQAWRQWALLLLLLALLPPLGLGGALVGVLLMELIFCGLGLWYVRDYWRTEELRLEWPYLRPYVRFGLSFFLANLATTTLYRSGPTLVELLTGDSRQTGYFNLALGLFLLAYVTVSQFAQGLIPMLSGLRVAGQMAVMRQWLRSFVHYSWWLSCLGALTVWLLADWGVPLVFGPEFTSATASLKWISLGMPLAALLWAGNVLATVTGRGRAKFGAALVALLTFILAVVWLAPFYGAWGAALALNLALVANVLVLVVCLQPNFALDGLMFRGRARNDAEDISINH